jgi:hypothetical protein
MSPLLVLTDFHFYLQMGEMLMYINSRPAHYKWHHNGELLFPDRNYARELFQLQDPIIYLMRTITPVG